MDLFDFLQPQSKTQVGFAFPETASFSDGNLKMRFREDSQRPVLYWKTSGDSKVIAIESRLNNKHFPEFLSGQWFVFYLLFIAGLLLIYLIVHQIIKRTSCSYSKRMGQYSNPQRGIVVIIANRFSKPEFFNKKIKIILRKG